MRYISSLQQIYCTFKVRNVNYFKIAQLSQNILKINCNIFSYLLFTESKGVTKAASFYHNNNITKLIHIAYMHPFHSWYSVTAVDIALYLFTLQLHDVFFKVDSIRYVVQGLWSSRRDTLCMRHKRSA